MRAAMLSAALAAVASVNALPAPQEVPSTKDSRPLPLSAFTNSEFAAPIPLDEAKQIFRSHNATEPEQASSETNSEPLFTTTATCANIRVRVEWHSYPDSSKQAFVDSIRCLMNRAPSGQFSQSRSRYEDIVALHQTLTPNVHGNAKFLVWHRYLLWAFEDMLRTECGFNQPMPWFDETRYPGRFSQSDVFTSRWFGGIALGGNCVRDGAFANLAINVGPGSGNQQHCLARNGDGSMTAFCNSDYVNQCNAYGDYAGMASCAESGPHAWGHNGIGAVMSDMYASPGDPVFWLHHAFVDRNFRIWQNMDSNRVRTINGNDASGRPLTLDTIVNIYGLRPDVRIRDILDTTETTLCYRYNY